MADKQEWYSVEMSKENAEKFKEYLFEQGIYYEPSEAGTLVHFECQMTYEELIKTNDWISKNL